MIEYFQMLTIYLNQASAQNPEHKIQKILIEPLVTEKYVFRYSLIVISNQKSDMFIQPFSYIFIVILVVTIIYII